MSNNRRFLKQPLFNCRQRVYACGKYGLHGGRDLVS